MVIVSCNDKSKDATSLALTAGAVAATAARVVLGGGALGAVGRTDDWALACFEWFNVGVCLWWSARRVGKDCGSQIWVLGKNVPNQLWTLSGDVLAKACGGLYLGTLAVTAAAGLHQGYLPVTPGQLWMISDMWADPPGNWISRWSVVQGVHFGALAHIAVYLATPAHAKHRKLCLVLALTSLFGLSIVGVCDESENIHLHTFGAVMYVCRADLPLMNRGDAAAAT